jgi:hypothetical protein
MARWFFAMLVLFVPAIVLLTTTGCEEKTVTVQQTEQRHESEPEMVSPGQEVLE